MSKIALPVLLIALVAGCGSATTPDAASSSTTGATTTTSTTASPPPTASKSGLPENQDLFVQALRAKGFVKTTLDETLVLAEGDLHCRSLADGLTRQKILDAAGLPGSDARTRSEAVFFAAVVSLCPEQASKATS